jgi:hypothetical protein
VDGNQAFLYDSTGQEVPNSTLAFVDSVARICDHVYYIEVDSLGYPPPASDSGAGGGNEYDVYIQSLPTGEYGYTDFDPSEALSNGENPTYATWMVLRDEFWSTYTHGIPAMEVTVAHEFHHGVQVGNYGLWPDDLWFYELTSTWMEQVVYPEVKDYYQYLSNFFDNVDLPFDLYESDIYAGYERCVFGIFVQNDYGTSLMKSIWENIARERPVPAIEDAFKSGGKDPSSVFQVFAQLNYLTNYRTQQASQFDVAPYPQATDYPLVKISGFAAISSSSSAVTFAASAMRLTEHFFQIWDGLDTIALAVANNNFGAAVNGDTTSFPFSVGISTGSSSCVKQLANGSCLFFQTTDYTDWGLIPFILDNTFAEEEKAVFPQPFNPSLQQLKIPNPIFGTSGISISIFSTSGILLRNLNSANMLGKYFVWDGKDANGKMVSSGVYVYVLSDGSKDVVGKIAVVRK